jgi:hypothetical protein
MLLIGERKYDDGMALSFSHTRPNRAQVVGIESNISQISAMMNI